MNSAKIVTVDAIPVNVTGPRPFRISEGQTAVHTSVILRLISDRGVEGNAEIVCAPPGKPEEFPEEILGALHRYVIPALTGAPADNRRAAMHRVEQALKGRIWTKAGVNNALFDLQAKLLGAPVASLLGGRALDEVPVIGPVVGMAAPDEMARIAAEEAKAGFMAIKIKVGETVETDIARVEAVREAIGPKVKLRVDANDHYRPADCIRLVRAIERLDIEHVEQPLPRYDILGMAEVKRNIGVPLMTDDMVATPMDAMNVIRLQAADRMKVKVTKHGLDGALAIVAMLESAGLAAVLGHVFEMGTWRRRRATSSSPARSARCGRWAPLSTSSARTCSPTRASSRCRTGPAWASPSTGTASTRCAPTAGAARPPEQQRHE
jgi:L-Ala-D/L-Glu epimerase